MARRWSSVSPEWIALALAAAALIIVHVAQAGGLVPCALCYLERWPYRLAALLAALGLAWAPSRRVIGPALVVVFLAAAGLAFLHTGVEAGWWKSPLPECAAPPLHTGSIRDLLASMPAHPAKPCDDPTYLIPGLRISMAQMNLLFALLGAALVAISVRRTGAPHE